MRLQGTIVLLVILACAVAAGAVFLSRWRNARNRTLSLTLMPEPGEASDVAGFDLDRPPARYRLNAPGDFYLADGECITCGAPEAAAPDLIAGTDEHCYFKRQPHTPEEVQRAIDAFDVSCCQAQRYAGSDPKILAELERRGLAGMCDQRRLVKR